MSATASAVFQRHRLTVADYYRMAEAGIFDEDDRVELIDGEIIDMAPIGSEHASSVKRLNRRFDRAVGEQAIVSVQNPVRLDEHNEPEPDIALLRYREDFYRSAHPGPDDVLLIVEVAHTSLRYDREIKLPLYARHRIPEVWVVDLDNRRLEIYRWPEGETYRDKACPAPNESIAPAALPECEVDLLGVF